MGESMHQKKENRKKAEEEDKCITGWLDFLKKMYYFPWPFSLSGILGESKLYASLKEANYVLYIDPGHQDAYIYEFKLGNNDDKGIPYQFWLLSTLLFPPNTFGFTFKETFGIEEAYATIFRNNLIDLTNSPKRTECFFFLEDTPRETEVVSIMTSVEIEPISHLRILYRCFSGNRLESDGFPLMKPTFRKHSASLFEKMGQIFEKMAEDTRVSAKGKRIPLSIATCYLSLSLMWFQRAHHLPGQSKVNKTRIAAKIQNLFEHYSSDEMSIQLLQTWIVDLNKYLSGFELEPFLVHCPSDFALKLSTQHRDTVSHMTLSFTKNQPSLISAFDGCFLKKIKINIPKFETNANFYLTYIEALLKHMSIFSHPLESLLYEDAQLLLDLKRFSFPSEESMTDLADTFGTKNTFFYAFYLPNFIRQTLHKLKQRSSGAEEVGHPIATISDNIKIWESEAVVFKSALCVMLYLSVLDFAETRQSFQKKACRNRLIAEFKTMPEKEVYAVLHYCAWLTPYQSPEVIYFELFDCFPGSNTWLPSLKSLYSTYFSLNAWWELASLKLIGRPQDTLEAFYDEGIGLKKEWHSDYTEYVGHLKNATVKKMEDFYAKLLVFECLHRKKPGARLYHYLKELSNLQNKTLMISVLSKMKQNLFSFIETLDLYVASLKDLSSGQQYLTQACLVYLKLYLKTGQKKEHEKVFSYLLKHSGIKLEQSLKKQNEKAKITIFLGCANVAYAQKEWLTSWSLVQLAGQIFQNLSIIDLAGLGELKDLYYSLGLILNVSRDDIPLFYQVREGDASLFQPNTRLFALLHDPSPEINSPSWVPKGPLYFFLVDHWLQSMQPEDSEQKLFALTTCFSGFKISNDIEQSPTMPRLLFQLSQFYLPLLDRNRRKLLLTEPENNLVRLAEPIFSPSSPLKHKFSELWKLYAECILAAWNAETVSLDFIKYYTEAALLLFGSLRDLNDALKNPVIQALYGKISFFIQQKPGSGERPLQVRSFKKLFLILLEENDWERATTLFRHKGKIAEDSPFLEKFLSLISKNLSKQNEEKHQMFGLECLIWVLYNQTIREFKIWHQAFLNLLNLGTLQQTPLFSTFLKKFSKTFRDNIPWLLLIKSLESQGVPDDTYKTLLILAIQCSNADALGYSEACASFFSLLLEKNLPSLIKQQFFVFSQLINVLSVQNLRTIYNCFRVLPHPELCLLFEKKNLPPIAREVLIRVFKEKDPSVHKAVMYQYLNKKAILQLLTYCHWVDFQPKLAVLLECFKMIPTLSKNSLRRIYKAAQEPLRDFLLRLNEQTSQETIAAYLPDLNEALATLQNVFTKLPLSREIISLIENVRVQLNVGQEKNEPTLSREAEVFNWLGVKERKVPPKEDLPQETTLAPIIIPRIARGLSLYINQYKDYLPDSTLTPGDWPLQCEEMCYLLTCFQTGNYIHAWEVLQGLSEERKENVSRQSVIQYYKAFFLYICGYPLEALELLRNIIQHPTSQALVLTPYAICLALEIFYQMPEHFNFEWVQQLTNQLCEIKHPRVLFLKFHFYVSQGEYLEAQHCLLSYVKSFAPSHRASQNPEIQFCFAYVNYLCRHFNLALKSIRQLLFRHYKDDPQVKIFLSFFEVTIFFEQLTQVPSSQEEPITKIYQPAIKLKITSALSRILRYFEHLQDLTGYTWLRHHLTLIGQEPYANEWYQKCIGLPPVETVEYEMSSPLPFEPHEHVRDFSSFRLTVPPSIRFLLSHLYLLSPFVFLRGTQVLGNLTPLRRAPNSKSNDLDVMLFYHEDVRSQLNALGFLEGPGGLLTQTLEGMKVEISCYPLLPNENALDQVRRIAKLGFVTLTFVYDFYHKIIYDFCGARESLYNKSLSTLSDVNTLVEKPIQVIKILYYQIITGFNFSDQLKDRLEAFKARVQEITSSYKIARCQEVIELKRGNLPDNLQAEFTTLLVRYGVSHFEKGDKVSFFPPPVATENNKEGEKIDFSF